MYKSVSNEEVIAVLKEDRLLVSVEKMYFPVIGLCTLTGSTLEYAEQRSVASPARQYYETAEGKYRVGEFEIVIDLSAMRIRGAYPKFWKGGLTEWFDFDHPITSLTWKEDRVYPSPELEGYSLVIKCEELKINEVTA